MAKIFARLALAGALLGGTHAPLLADEVPDNAPGGVPWKFWPHDAAVCNQSWVQAATNDYGGPSKYEALYHLSLCAHATVANIEAYAYAISRTGSSKFEGLRSLTEFAAQIESNPTATASCLQREGIEPFDKDGSWRDLTSLIVDVARHSSRGSAC